MNSRVRTNKGTWKAGIEKSIEDASILWVMCRDYNLGKEMDTIAKQKWISYVLQHDFLHQFWQLKCALETDGLQALCNTVICIWKEKLYMIAPNTITAYSCKHALTH